MTAIHDPPTGRVRDWILTDDIALDLEIAVVRFPGTGARQGDLLAALRGVNGVRHVLDLSHDRSVIAIVVFPDANHRRAIRAQLEEVSTSLEWDDVLFESQESTINTWRWLARAAAEAEGLLL
jgi:hypothetical protein